MSKEADRVDAYLNTIERLEPDIAMTDKDASLTSIAISAKRIADTLDNIFVSIISDPNRRVTNYTSLDQLKIMRQYIDAAIERHNRKDGGYGF